MWLHWLHSYTLRKSHKTNVLAVRKCNQWCNHPWFVWLQMADGLWQVKNDGTREEDGANGAPSSLSNSDCVEQPLYYVLARIARNIVLTEITIVQSVVVLRQLIDGIAYHACDCISADCIAGCQYIGEFGHEADIVLRVCGCQRRAQLKTPHAQVADPPPSDAHLGLGLSYSAGVGRGRLGGLCL